MLWTNRSIPLSLYSLPIIRLWSKLTAAIAKKDMEAATEAKATVEDAQRDDTKKRDESNEKFVPRYFELRDGLWHAKFRSVPILILFISFYLFVIAISWCHLILTQSCPFASYVCY